jgi:hypothetical protein
LHEAVLTVEMIYQEIVTCIFLIWKQLCQIPRGVDFRYKGSGMHRNECMNTSTIDFPNEYRIAIQNYAVYAVVIKVDILIRNSS